MSDTYQITPPADVPELMHGMWASCLMWSVTEPAIMESFRAETGVAWTPGRTPIEQMIDKAAGADVGFLRQYVEWFNANVWGSWDGPDDGGAQ